MFFSPKVAIPVLVGLVGTSVATATTLSTTSFFSPKKCWYDGEKDGSFLEKVEEVINGKFDEKIKSEIKNLIKSLCTKAPGISLTEFEEKFNYEDYNDVLKLLIEKRSSIKKSQNQ